MAASKKNDLQSRGKLVIQVMQNNVRARQRYIKDPEVVAVKHSAGGSTPDAISAPRQRSASDALRTETAVLGSASD